MTASHPSVHPLPLSPSCHSSCRCHVTGFPCESVGHVYLFFFLWLSDVLDVLTLLSKCVLSLFSPQGCLIRTKPLKPPWSLSPPPHLFPLAVLESSLAAICPLSIRPPVAVSFLLPSLGSSLLPHEYLGGVFLQKRSEPSVRRGSGQ